MYTTRNLSHAEAQAMIEAVRGRLEAEKKAGAIAVTDSHGELIAFLRMDGCHLPPGTDRHQQGVHRGARAAAVRAPSENHPARVPFPMTNYGDLRYTGWAGGLPVLVDGQVVGAIGISGLDEAAESELGAFAVELVTRK